MLERYLCILILPRPFALKELANQAPTAPCIAHSGPSVRSGVNLFVDEQ